MLGLEMINMTEFFTTVGASVIITMIMVMIFAVIYAIRNFIRERIWIYKYNHRFDKPPTAKCYCKDCSLYGDFQNRRLCRKHKSHFSEDYFCKDADPRKAESGLAREKIREKKVDN